MHGYRMYLQLIKHWPEHKWSIPMTSTRLPRRLMKEFVGGT